MRSGDHRRTRRRARGLAWLLAGLCGAPAYGQSDDCAPEGEPGWLARSSLERSLARSFGWIELDFADAALYACRRADGVLEVSLDLPPHLRRPRWELYWEVSCRREGWLSWECSTPEQRMRVRLAADDLGALVFDGISSAEALAALAAVIRASRGSGIVDPFDRSGPPLRLRADQLLSVSREEFCRGLMVTGRAQDDQALLELCVTSAECAPGSRCAPSVALQGKTE